MEKRKALLISDIFEEPRTGELYSELQIGRLNEKSYLEFTLQNMEGIGSMFALLTYDQNQKEAIDYAINHGAKIIDVWVIRDIELMENFKSNKIYSFPSICEGELVCHIFRTFFGSSESFIIHGDYKGNSGLHMHDYETYVGVFSDETDAKLFLQIIDLFKGTLSEDEIKTKGEELLRNRVKKEHEHETWNKIDHF